MLLTVDSSVMVAALSGQEPSHAPCLRLMQRVFAGEHTGVQPLTVLVEVVAAIRRRSGSPRRAERAHGQLRTMTSLRFVAVDRRRADAAARIARDTGLRGMDAIIVQVAQEFGSSLITLDDEMRRLAQGRVSIQAVTDV